MPSIKLWFWTITSNTYPCKRMKTTWRMTEEEARKCHGDDAMKVEGSLYITEVGTGSYQPPGYTREREPGEDGVAREAARGFVAVLLCKDPMAYLRAN